MSRGAPLPFRPRLAEHVLVRRHVVSGQGWVMLENPVRETKLRMPAESWDLVSFADGTRDVDGVLLAASRRVGPVRESQLLELLRELHAQDMLVDGVRSPRLARDEPEQTPPDRPLDVLPGYSLRCDGRGDCCRQYGSVLFSPLDALRARVLLPAVLDGATRPERVFSPARGSVADELEAVTLLDGRCAYLQGDLCAIHAKAGETAKPLRCRLFPATLVDDGEAVRVSVMVECACVLASLEPGDGWPLVPEGATRRGDLEEGTPIARLAARLPVSAHADGARGDVVAWSRAVLAGCADAGIDVPRRLWALAEAIEREGLGGHARAAAIDHQGPPEAGTLRPWLEALSTRALRGVSSDDWKSPLDRSRVLTRWVSDAAARLLADDTALHARLAAPPPHPTAEAFYLRATLHGHHLFQRPVPLSAALRDRALRLLVARTLPEVVARDAPADPARSHPLAAVEAVMRGHGVGAYVADMAASGATR